MSNDLKQPTGLVVLALDFPVDQQWAAEIERNFGLKIVDPDDLSAGEVTVALVDDSVGRQLLEYRNLQLILSLSAGVEQLLEVAELPDIPIARLINPEMTALMREYVCYFALRLHREFHLTQADQRNKCWEWHAPQRSAADRRVTILGAGQLGMAAGLGLSALGFPATAWGRSEKLEAAMPIIAGKEALFRQLSGTWLVVNLLPSTPETKGLLNAAFFSALPRGASLINAGRGDAIVEKDLLEALDSGQLKQAVLDVFQEEPLPADNRLWQHPQVTITPHCAAYPMPETYQPVIEAALSAFFNGESVPGSVSRENGY